MFFKQNLIINHSQDFHIFVANSEEQIQKLKHYLSLKFYKSTHDINIKKMKDERYIFNCITSISIEPPKIDLKAFKSTLKENKIYLTRVELRKIFKRLKVFLSMKLKTLSKILSRRSKQKISVCKANMP